MKILRLIKCFIRRASMTVNAEGMEMVVTFIGTAAALMIVEHTFHFVILKYLPGGSDDFFASARFLVECHGSICYNGFHSSGRISTSASWAS